MNFELEVQKICEEALKVLKVGDSLKFRPMRRRKKINFINGVVLGRTNLRTGLITIDIFTLKTRKPKKISSILRTLCHEVAHHQKPPYKQFFRFKWINRQHYPKFYKQVNKNIKKLRNNYYLKNYF